MPYLLKSEPETYSFSDLERDKETTWDGVKNPQALMNLAGMKKGEKLVIYHTVTEKAVVGTAHVVSGAGRGSPPAPETLKTSAPPGARADPEIRSFHCVGVLGFNSRFTGIPESP